MSITTSSGKLLIRGGKDLESPSPALTIRVCWFSSVYFPAVNFGNNPSSFEYRPPSKGRTTIPQCTWFKEDRDMCHDDAVNRRIGLRIVHEFPSAIGVKPVRRAFHAEQPDCIHTNPDFLSRIAQQIQSCVFERVGQILVAPVIDPFALMVAEHAVAGRNLGQCGHEIQHCPVVILIADYHVARKQDQVGLQCPEIGDQRLVVVPVFSVVDV